MICSTHKVIAYLILCPLLAAQQLSPPAPAPATVSPHPLQKFVTIRKDTEIELISLEGVSSATATKGQLVQLAVAKDLMVDGLVVIPKGTPATGVVSRLTKGVPGKRDGFLRVVPRMLLLNNGKTIKLSEYRSGENDCDPLGPCWAMYTLFAPIFLATWIASHVPDEVPSGKDDAINACESLIWRGYTKRLRIESTDLPAARPMPENAVPCKLVSEAKIASAATPPAAVAADNPVSQLR
jgi:hypothetical protein